MVRVSSEEAVNRARSLCAEQGLVVGISSGCNVAAAGRLLARHPGARVATVLFDTGHKYYSTALFGQARPVASPPRPHVLDERSVRQLDRYAPGWEILD